MFHFGFIIWCWEIEAEISLIQIVSTWKSEREATEDLTATQIRNSTGSDLRHIRSLMKKTQFIDVTRPCTTVRDSEDMLE